jgi:hypothetical protein
VTGLGYVLAGENAPSAAFPDKATQMMVCCAFYIRLFYDSQMLKVAEQL